MLFCSFLDCIVDIFSQIGGRLSSLGKPELILQVEELLWRCIVGVAWGSWTSEVGLNKFLENVAPLVDNMDSRKQVSKGNVSQGNMRWTGYQGEDTWFERNIQYIQHNRIPGLEARVGQEISEWLEDSRGRWIARVGPEKNTNDRGRARSQPPRRVPRPRQQSRSRTVPFTLPRDQPPPLKRESVPKVVRLLTYRVHKWGHENYPSFDKRPEWKTSPSLPPAMFQDIEPIRVQDIVVGELPPVRETSSKSRFLSRSQQIQHERKLSQDIDTSWRELMLMAPSLQIMGSQDIVPSISGRKRGRSHTIDTSVDVALKKAKVDRGLSRSTTGIESPLLWVPRTNSYASFEYFPLKSNVWAHILFLCVPH